LQHRFTLAIAALVAAGAIAGAGMLVTLESGRVSAAALAEREDHVRGLNTLLETTDALMLERARAAMKLLRKEAAVRGTFAAGPRVAVGERQVPDLLIGGRGLAGQHDLVDAVTAISGGTATLFTLDGESFVRISTNVMKDGKRAVGTVLDPNGKAIQSIRRGEAFYGTVDILGDPFITGYEPIRDEGGRTIGVLYVGYKIDTKSIADTVRQGKLLDSGFLALVDAKGTVRFHSENVTPERVTALLKDRPGEWELASERFAPWDFAVVAAYPHAEVTRRLASTAWMIVGGTLILGAALVLALRVLLGRLVLRPLGGEPDAARQIAEKLAQGDLSETIQAPEGTLLGALATTQESLRRILRHLDDSAQALASAATELSATSTNVSDASAKQSEFAGEIAAQTRQIEHSLGAVSTRIDQVHGTRRSAQRQRPDDRGQRNRRRGGRTHERHRGRGAGSRGGGAGPG
jgi:hypothetical protein